ncbi:hypothetical protein F5B22DRAFT_531687 [Xylaria bambusicola]|uniref:uncharacterized protein n=1 Tax=Xylaria bambusicola TaxID=326684 RepID=UPI0020088C94|nr:uncharacterized protein F5B22DRAFT_531687 [Xylaria bambusicola]KAI0505269.1 hypothetical protein F5B22DRAFT_531687 [Xylaria bambusicola]
MMRCLSPHRFSLFLSQITINFPCAHLAVDLASLPHSPSTCTYIHISSTSNLAPIFYLHPCISKFFSQSNLTTSAAMCYYSQINFSCGHQSTVSCCCRYKGTSACLPHQQGPAVIPFLCSPGCVGV